MLLKRAASQITTCMPFNYAEGSFLLPVCRTQNMNRITCNQIRNNCLRHDGMFQTNVNVKLLQYNNIRNL